jgi:hypothetical protein
MRPPANRPKRRRSPRLPYFRPLEELSLGDPFRPYKLFELSSVRGVVLASKLLRPGAKVVWMLLADQCASSGYDRHTQVNLAEHAGMSLTQFRHHLGRLVKLNLVHIEPELGRQNFTWLLYHPMFAFCSPYTPSETRVRDPRKPDEGILGNPITQRNYQRNYQRRGPQTVDVGTSNRGSSDANSEEETKAWRTQKTNGSFPITNRVSTLPVSAEAKTFWFSLSPLEKQKRQELGAIAAERVAYYRRYINETDRTIAGQARREVKRYLSELRSYGFFIPGLEPEVKR